MHTYDIRNMIKRENKKKLTRDIAMVIILFVVAIVFIIALNLTKVFNVISPESDKALENAYNNGAKYITFDKSQLEYTGYYKLNKNEEVIYNCYSLCFDTLKYFVFVPVNKSGSNPKDPTSILTDYSFTAKLQSDAELFQMVSTDYNLSTDDLYETYGISPIIFNEVKSDRSQILAIWVLIFIVFIISGGFVILSFIHIADVTKHKAVMDLSEYGNLENVLNEINEEINEGEYFDSDNIKITENWILGFNHGHITIVNFLDIKNIEQLTKTKKVFEIMSNGYHVFIKINKTDGKVLCLPVETDCDALTILKISSRILPMGAKNK